MPGEVLRSENSYEELKPVMKNFICLHVSFDIIQDRALYSGMHPDFRRLKFGARTPTYSYDIVGDKVIWKEVKK